ncbi:expressed unknown protein [Seminavis robusta]|uniref:Uncharacterized protein n=1 Tax=Seminavis robusta TaxID=568900 RepID=A0A9N8DK40_9STRA|nr:expressed unknown protein [Seminavis robusta]|eukprot:Sro198_g084050.1 n/a (248) ;mRNA; f:38626-39369
MRFSSRTPSSVILVLFVVVRGSLSLPLFRTVVPMDTGRRRFTISSTTLGGGSNNHGNPFSNHHPHHTSNCKDSHNNNNENSDQNDRRSVHLIVPRAWARTLYIFSAFNPFLAVFFNDYSHMVEFAPHMQSAQHIRVLAKTYQTLFFFARLKPRVSFAIGAALRALQLTTAFQYVFDPTIGVGFGLNLLCLYAKSRWPATIVLGWAISKPLWKVLGANPPSGLPVPITISLKPNKDAPVATKGYRIGL